jgi:hypothetical protein
MHIGQSNVTATEAVGQFFVVDPAQTFHPPYSSTLLAELSSLVFK